jgi:hypothetical protein
MVSWAYFYFFQNKDGILKYVQNSEFGNLLECAYLKALEINDAKLVKMVQIHAQNRDLILAVFRISSHERYNHKHPMVLQVIIIYELIWSETI